LDTLNQTDIHDQQKDFNILCAFTMPFTASPSDIISKMQQQLQRANSPAAELPLHTTTCDNRLQTPLDIQISDLLEILPPPNTPIPLDGSQFIPEGVKSCARVWTCCNCAHSGMLTSSDICPVCGHVWCDYCDVYTPKR
jgi:hypothetical protein